MKDIIQAFTMAAKESPRMFFAPLVGAFNAIGEEFRRINAASAVPVGSHAIKHQSQ